MMSADFSKEMTAVWPGYWGAPLKTLDANPDDFTGLSKQYILAIQDMSDAVNKGDFGYFTATFFPPATQQEMVNIDSVWLGQTSAQSFLSKVESTFKTELDKKLVPPIPEPAAQG
ncbi:hypothetical protein ACFQYP_52090 [Nonomuraea antimicrobica]